MAAPVVVNRMRGQRRTLRRVSLLAGLAAAAWAMGLGWFLSLAAREAPPMERVDGIVALTGGPGRVEAALRLLTDGTAHRLLVSGTGEKTDLAALAHRAGIDAAPLADRITLGRAAHSTHGNALETRVWARERKIDSLLVVTAWFHMPRAMIEFRRAMPGIRTYPHPVGRFALTELGHGGMARRLIGEYHKYLAAAAGITLLPFARNAPGMHTPDMHAPDMEPAG